ncbi:hypothetical protein L4D76_14860 [Photobacterium sagamiensis]|uniref:O-antigen ligase family protein n=1 Tax=Photobacterium sagamiensis TaxID=2910241 RepID=UPI003D14BB6D
MNRITNQITILFIACLMGIAYFSFNLFMLGNDLKDLYNYKRIFVCAILIILSFMVFGQISFRENLIAQFKTMKSTAAILLVVLFFSAAIANSFGFYFYRAQTDYFYFIGLVLFTTTISVVCYENRSRIFVYFSIFSYLLFLSVLVGHWLIVFWGNQTSNFAIIGFFNPRMLNQVQAWIIIPVFYLAVIARYQSKSSLLSTLPAALNFSIIVALDGRGVAISSISAILLWAWFDKPLRKTILFVLIYSLFIGFFVKYIFLSPLPEYLYLGIVPESWIDIRTTPSGRLAIWMEALQMTSFWGHGGDAYACNATLSDLPHNSILLILVNWGVIAAISYIMLLLYCLKTVYFTKHRIVRVTGLSVLSGFAYSLVSAVIYSPLSQLIGAISIAFFWAACNHFTTKSITDDVSINSRRKHILLKFCSIMLVGLVGYKVYLRIDNNHYRDMPMDSPQFWLGQNCIDEEPRLLLEKR